MVNIFAKSAAWRNKPQLRPLSVTYGPVLGLSLQSGFRVQAHALFGQVGRAASFVFGRTLSAMAMAMNGNNANNAAQVGRVRSELAV